MQRKSFFIFLFLTGFLTFGQECPSLTFPVDGATNVPIDLTITWNSVENIEGFLLSLGTTPGGNNILNSRSAGNINYFTPDTGLPAHTVIYATISLFMGEGEGLKVCSSEVFTTETITELPPCTALNMPVNNATEVRTGTEIFWNYSFSAIGYLLSIGTSSGEYDILFDVDVGNVLSYRPDQDFPVNQEIYVTLVPYNENGERTNCVEERFRTGSNNIDCSEFLPIIDIPDQVGICVNDFPKRILGNVASSGVRWFKINNDNSETLLSENPEYFIEEIGHYRYEVYNEVSLFGDTGQCMASKEFTVIVSEQPQISNVDISRGRQGLNIVIGAIGSGDYEYAVENRVNSFQDSPIFQNIEPADLTIFVRDKNGCGVAERSIMLNLSSANFPRFFTPNGDGVNDYWQFVPHKEGFADNLDTIHIFDRYGTLLAEINSVSQGWDGTFKGKPLPSSDYWFRAVSLNNQEVSGHFTLKR